MLRRREIRDVFKEPYPMNLLLTINMNSVYEIHIDVRKVEQRHLDELLCAMGTLTEREREMLRLRFEERYLLKEIGEVYSLTQERVRRIIYTAMRKLRPSLSILQNNGK